MFFSPFFQKGSVFVPDDARDVNNSPEIDDRDRDDRDRDRQDDSINDLLADAVREINETPGILQDGDELRLDRQEGGLSETLMVVDKDGKERDLTREELNEVYDKFDEKMKSINESNKGMDQDLVARAFDLAEAKAAEARDSAKGTEREDQEENKRTTPLEDSKELAIAGLSKKEIKTVEAKAEEILKAEKFKDVVIRTADKAGKNASQQRQDAIKELNAAKSNGKTEDIHQIEKQIGEYKETISRCTNIEKLAKGYILNASRKNAYRTDLTRGLARNFRKDSKDLVDSLKREDPKVVAAASRYADAKIKLKELEKQPPGENRDKEVEAQRDKLARAINRFSPEDKEKIRDISQKLIKTHETRESLKNKLSEEIRRLESAKKDEQERSGAEKRAIARNLAHCKKMNRVLNSKGKNDRTITGRYINKTKDDAKLSIERVKDRPTQKAVLIENDRNQQKYKQFEKEYASLSDADKLKVDKYLNKPDERVLEKMSSSARDVALKGERIRYDNKRIQHDNKVLSAEAKAERQKEKTERMEALRESTKNIVDKSYKEINAARDNKDKIKKLKSEVGKLQNNLKGLEREKAALVKKSESQRTPDSAKTKEEAREIKKEILARKSTIKAIDRKIKRVKNNIKNKKKEINNRSKKNGDLKKESNNAVFSLLREYRDTRGEQAKDKLDKMLEKFKDENKKIEATISKNRLVAIKNGNPPINAAERTYIENREKINAILDARSEISTRLDEIGKDANASLDRLDKSVIDKATTERAVREDKEKIKEINKEIKSLQISPERQKELLEGRMQTEKQEDKAPQTKEEERFLELLKEKDAAKISLVKNEFLRDCAKATREYRENRNKPENYEKLNFVKTSIDTRQEKEIAKKEKAVVRNVRRRTEDEKKAEAQRKVIDKKTKQIEKTLDRGHTRTVGELDRDFDKKLQDSKDCLERVRILVGKGSDVETRFVMNALLKDIPMTKETAESFGIMEAKFEYMKNIAAEIKTAQSDVRDEHTNAMISLESRWLDLLQDKSLTQEQRVDEIYKMVSENDKIPPEDKSATVDYLEKIKSVSECKNLAAFSNVTLSNLEARHSISDQEMDQRLDIIASRAHIDVLLKTVDPKFQVENNNEMLPIVIRNFSSVINEVDAKISRAGDWENGKIVVSNEDYYRMSNQIVDEKIQLLSRTQDEVFKSLTSEEKILYYKLVRDDAPSSVDGLSKDLIIMREIDSKISDLMLQKTENTHMVFERDAQKYVRDAVGTREVETFAVLNNYHSRFSLTITKERATQMDYDKLFNDTFDSITRKGGIRSMDDASNEVKAAIKFSPYSGRGPDELKPEFKLARENSVIAAIALKDAIYDSVASGALSPDKADQLYKEVLTKHMQAEFIKGTFNTKYIAGQTNEMLSLNNALVRSDHPENASLLATEYVRTLSSVERTLAENGVAFSYDKLTAGNDILAEAIHKGAREPDVFKDQDFYSKFQEERLDLRGYIEKTSEASFKDAQDLLGKLNTMTRLVNNSVDPGRQGDANSFITKEQLEKSRLMGKKAEKDILLAQAKLNEIRNKWADGALVTESDLSTIINCRETINKCIVDIERKEKAEEMISRFTGNNNLRELSTEDLKRREERLIRYFKTHSINYRKIRKGKQGALLDALRGQNPTAKNIIKNEAAMLKMVTEELKYRKSQERKNEKGNKNKNEQKQTFSNLERLPEYQKFKAIIERTYGKGEAEKIVLAAKDRLVTAYDPSTIISDMNAYCDFFESRGIDMADQRFAVRVAGELITVDYFEQRGPGDVIDNINRYDDYIRDGKFLDKRQKEEYDRLQAAFDVAMRERVESIRDQNRGFSKNLDKLNRKLAEIENIEDPEEKEIARSQEELRMGISFKNAIDKLSDARKKNNERINNGQEIIRIRELYKAQLNRANQEYSYNPSFLIAKNSIGMNNPGMLDIDVSGDGSSYMDIPGRYPPGLSIDSKTADIVNSLFDRSPLESDAISVSNLVSAY